MKTDIIIITSFSAYEPRAEFVKNFFLSQGKKVKIITTDFQHREKLQRKNIPNDYIPVLTKPYKKNLSFTRLYSHYVFSHDAVDLAFQYMPSILYVLIPANSLARFASIYKKKYKWGGKLILDIIDLWPESLPLQLFKKNPFSFMWKKMRDCCLESADLIITECCLYNEILRLKNHQTIYNTVYWAQTSYPYVEVMLSKTDTFNLLYLGSINNIIDIPLIVTILKKIRTIKEPFLHIIGTGEKSKKLINFLETEEIQYEYHGACYEHEYIHTIASKCHFGLNIMKTSVAVGLTMKSVSYFELGLPVINNLRGDIWSLVNKYNAGFNLSKKADIPIGFFDTNSTNLMRRNARLAFEKHFSDTAIMKCLFQTLSQLDISDE